MTAPSRPGRAPVAAAAPRIAERARAERGQRRRRTLRRLGKALLVLVPLAAAAWVLLASSWLAVERQLVVGTERLTPEQVLAAVGVPEGTPLARVDTGAAGRRVTQLAPVAEVAVRRAWPRTLRVEVVERTAVAGVVADDGVLLLDRAGVSFAREPVLPAGVVRLQVESPGPDDPATRAALEVHAELPETLRERVAIVHAASPSAVQLRLRDGRTVVWGGPGQSATKAAAVEALLPRAGSTVDVSSPGVATTR